MMNNNYNHDKNYYGDIDAENVALNSTDMFTYLSNNHCDVDHN